MTNFDSNFVIRLTEKLITTVVTSVIKLVSRHITWKNIKPLFSRAGECLMQSLTFRTPRKEPGKFRRFTYAVLLYLLAIEAALEFTCAILLSLDTGHPMALWRRGAGLMVALATLAVTHLYHVEADAVKDDLSKDSHKLW